MTVQQLEYIVALAEYGHFSEAAYAINVSQPTLSATIAKLENELDVTIFDRSRHPIVPTAIGRKIVEQAKTALSALRRIPEIALDEKNSVSGEVKLGVIPTIAPYIVPDFFTQSKKLCPDLSVTISEMPTEREIPALKRGDLDIAILATRNADDSLLEIPLYKEALVVYASKGHPYLDSATVSADILSGDDLWVLRSEHCLSTQIFNICKIKKDFSTSYSAGNIFTLINIVDRQGGYTLIPEFHIGMLGEEQKTRVRRFAAPEPVRTVSLFIRSDYYKEGVLNAVAKCISAQVPENRLEDSHRKGGWIKI